MEPRYFDPRVGYFATSTTDFDADPQGVKKLTMITRWRLEPKAEDLDKFRRGELVEPKKPIVFYIDPATPVKWRKYLIQGLTTGSPPSNRLDSKTPSTPAWRLPAQKTPPEPRRRTLQRHRVQTVRRT